MYQTKIIYRVDSFRFTSLASLICEARAQALTRFLNGIQYKLELKLNST